MCSACSSSDITVFSSASFFFLLLLLVDYAMRRDETCANVNERKWGSKGDHCCRWEEQTEDARDKALLANVSCTCADESASRMDQHE